MNCSKCANILLGLFAQNGTVRFSHLFAGFLSDRRLGRGEDRRELGDGDGRGEGEGVRRRALPLRSNF